MGHKVYGADLVAVQIDGGLAEDCIGLDGGGDALRQRKAVGDFVIGVAVAADRFGGVELDGPRTAALGQGHGGQRGGGVHQSPVCKAGEGPVQQLGGFFVNVVQVGAEDDQTVGVAVLLGKGDIAAACQRGEAGLHAPDVVAVVGIFGVQHQVGGGDAPLVLVQVGGREGVAQGVGDLHIGLVGGAGRGDEREVAGRGDVAVIVQAVHTGEAGAGAAQLLGLLVHHRDKIGQAARHIVGDDAGGIVGAGHQQAVQQVDAAHGLADAQIHGAAVGVLDVLELLCQAGGNGDLFVQVFAAFEKEQGRHHLGQAGDIPLLPGVLVQDGLVDVCVEQIDRLALVGGLDGHLVHGQTGQRGRDGQHDRQQQSRHPAEERSVLHERILPKFQIS